jgi:hypothetical protein
MINGLPVSSAPSNATAAQNRASSIARVSVAESGNAAGETFTGTLADTNRDDDYVLSRDRVSATDFDQTGQAWIKPGRDDWWM